MLDGRDLGARGAQRARAAARAAEQRVTAAEAERRAADASLALARATHDRIASLQAKRSATPQELDEATARASGRRSAGRRRRRAVAAGHCRRYERAGRQRSGRHHRVVHARSPRHLTGVVTEKMVEPGNMASPGTPLLRLEDTRGFRLDVRVDESRVGTVALGRAVPVLSTAGDAPTARHGTLNGAIRDRARGG